LVVARWHRDQDLKIDVWPAAWQMPTTLRLATADDGPALGRLAELDSNRLSPGPHLVADRDGRIDAALSLATGELIADPFHPTADLCELLRCHAGEIRATRQRSASSWLHPRPLPAAT
jgi:hypothetical protein